MRTHMLAVAVCILFSSAAFGQTPWRFRSDNYAGVAIGQLGTYGRAETVNGLYRGPWFLGIGTGLDYYRFRTVPLYLSVMRDVLGAGKKSGLFLHLDGGVSLPWFLHQAPQFDYQSNTFSPGILWTGGLGYRRKLSARGDKALLFTASYGVRRIVEHETGDGYNGIMPILEPVRPPSYEYDYVNRVFLLSIGFQF